MEILASSIRHPRYSKSYVADDDRSAGSRLSAAGDAREIRYARLRCRGCAFGLTQLARTPATPGVAGMPCADACLPRLCHGERRSKLNEAPRTFGRARVSHVKRALALYGRRQTYRHLEGAP